MSYPCIEGWLHYAGSCSNLPPGCSADGYPANKLAGLGNVVPGVTAALLSVTLFPLALCFVLKILSNQAPQLNPTFLSLEGGGRGVLKRKNFGLLLFDSFVALTFNSLVPPPPSSMAHIVFPEGCAPTVGIWKDCIDSFPPLHVLSVGVQIFCLVIHLLLSFVCSGVNYCFSPCVCFFSTSQFSLIFASISPHQCFIQNSKRIFSTTGPLFALPEIPDGVLLSPLP